jgi:putative transposase
MSYPSDLTDDQWELLKPVFNAPGERGRKHADDLRTVVDAMPCIAQTGCQWRYLPEPFGPWTRVWSQFRRWSRSGTWAQALTVMHAAARESDGRAERTPSLVVIGASPTGSSWSWWTEGHDRCGPHTLRLRRRGPPGRVGWLQVACIATTLRHQFREEARRRPAAFAA